MAGRISYTYDRVEVFAGRCVSGVLRNDIGLARSERGRREVHRRSARAGAIGLENRRLDDRRCRDIIGVVPFKNKGSITASVDSLGDVEPVRIEIMKAAGEDSLIDPGKVDVSSRQGRVSSGGKASAISDWAVDRGIAIGTPVVRGRGRIGHACCHDVVDGLGDNTVGKHWLIEIRDVITDDITSEAL